MAPPSTPTPAPTPVHLVGSFPTPDAETAFRKCCTALKGRRLKSVPDGEPGWRWNFTIGLVQKKATENPRIGKIWREYDQEFKPLPVQDFSDDEEVEELREGIRETCWKLGYADDAIESYKTFLRLRGNGVIERDVRFQVCLPGMSSFAIFVKPQFQYLVEDLAFQALLKEVDEITAAIPAHDLALQFDIASDFIKTEVQRDPAYYLYGSQQQQLRDEFHPPPTEDAMQRYTTQYATLIGRVANTTTTHVGLHICCGNIDNKPVLQPKDMTVMVDFVNTVRDKLDARPIITYVHFGCLQHWTDPSFYAPLTRLLLPPPPDTIEIYLGIVYPDDLEGARRRLEAAGKHDVVFGIAAPCGLARTSEGEVESVFSILKELTPPGEEVR